MTEVSKRAAPFKKIKAPTKASTKAIRRPAPAPRAPKKRGLSREKSAQILEKVWGKSPARFLGLRKEQGNLHLSRVVVRGLPPESLECLANALGITMGELLTSLSISKQTLSRRRQEGTLNTLESDRAARYASLLNRVVILMGGDQAAANRWLHSPQSLLDGETPMDHAQTEAGAKEVYQLIGRLEQGVYS